MDEDLGLKDKKGVFINLLSDWLIDWLIKEPMIIIKKKLGKIKYDPNNVNKKKRKKSEWICQVVNSIN